MLKILISKAKAKETRKAFGKVEKKLKEFFRRKSWNEKEKICGNINSNKIKNFSLLASSKIYPLKV